jgi:hypothetical protein
MDLLLRVSAVIFQIFHWQEEACGSYVLDPPLLLVETDVQGVAEPSRMVPCVVEDIILQRGGVRLAGCLHSTSDLMVASSVGRKSSPRHQYMRCIPAYMHHMLAYMRVFWREKRATHQLQLVGKHSWRVLVPLVDPDQVFSDICKSGHRLGRSSRHKTILHCLFFSAGNEYISCSSGDREYILPVFPDAFLHARKRLIRVIFVCSLNEAFGNQIPSEKRGSHRPEAQVFAMDFLAETEIRIVNLSVCQVRSRGAEENQCGY